jgi:TPR repeat protein
VGVASAQNNLGTCYSSGLGVTQNYTKAAEWYRKAAEQGVAGAQVNLGGCYYNGTGVARDYVEAVRWYKKAAIQGEGNNLALCYANGLGVAKDLNRAKEIWLELMAKGNKTAKENFDLFFDKSSVESESNTAIRELREKAERGDTGAQVTIGNAYLMGSDGVTQNYEEAVKWFRKAAAVGHASAQNNLGTCYSSGLGVTQSYTKAAEWYRKAAEQGNAGAQNCLGAAYLQGEGVAQDYAEAVRWFRKADIQGDGNNLAICYANGLGVAKDLNRAKEIWQKLMAKGDATARDNFNKFFGK